MPLIAAATYKLIPASTPFIDGTALWHIVVISLAFGAGLALAFGVALLGFEHGEHGTTIGERSAGFLLTATCAVLCVVAVGVGVYVMANPPKTKPLKVVRVTSTASIASTRAPAHS